MPPPTDFHIRQTLTDDCISRWIIPSRIISTHFSIKPSTIIVKK